MRFDIFHSLQSGQQNTVVPFWEVWFHKDHLVPPHQHDPKHHFEAQVRTMVKLGMAAMRIGGVPLNCTFARRPTLTADGRHVMTGGLTSLDQLETHPLPLWTGLTAQLDDFKKIANGAGLSGVIYQPWGFQSVLKSMGLEALQDKAASDPEFVSRAIGWVEDRNRAAFNQVVREVLPDAVLFDGTGCCDANGLVLPMPIFRDLVYEETAETLSFLIENRIPAIFSTGGAVHELLPLLLELGFTGCHGLDPQYNDLGAMARRFGNRLVLIGNMDPGLLARAGIEEIKAATTTMLQHAYRQGGYIASCCAMPSDSIPDAHYLAFCETIHNYRG